MARVKFAHPLLVELQNTPLPSFEQGLEEWVQESPEDYGQGATLRDDREWYTRHFNTVTPWTPDAVDRLGAYLLASHGFLSPDETYRLTWEITVNQNRQLAVELARLESEVMFGAKKAIRSVLDKVKNCGEELAKLYTVFQSEQKLLFTEHASRNYLEGQKHLLLLFRTFRSVVLNCSLALEEVTESGCSVLRDTATLSSEASQTTVAALRGTLEILTIENAAIAGFSTFNSEHHKTTGSRLFSKKLEHGYESTRLPLFEMEVDLVFKRPGLGMVSGVTSVSSGGLHFKMLGEVRSVFHASNDTRLIFCSLHEVVFIEGFKEKLRVRASASALPRYLYESAEVFIPSGSGEIWTLTNEGQIFKYSPKSEVVMAFQFGKDIQLELAKCSKRLSESARPVPALKIEVAMDPLDSFLIGGLFLGTVGDYRQKSKYPKTLRELIERGPRALLELGISKRTISKLEARSPRLVRQAWGDVQWPTAKVNAELLAMSAAGFNVVRDDCAEEISNSPSISESVRFQSFTPVKSWTYTDELGLCMKIAEDLRIRQSRTAGTFLIDVPPISERFHRTSKRAHGDSGGAERVDFMNYKFSKQELKLMELYSQSLANFREGYTGNV